MRARRAVLFAGAVILVLGILFAYDLLMPQTAATQPIPSASSEYIVEYRAPVDLLFPRIVFTVEWVSTEYAANLTVLACGADAACRHPSAAPVAYGFGMRGNLTFPGRANEYYLLRPYGGAMDVTVGYLTPIYGGAVGFAMILGGVTLIAIGLTGRSRPATPAEETDEEAGAPEAPPP